MDWQITYKEISRKKELVKIRLDYVDICGQGKVTTDKNGRSYGQDDVINASMLLGVKILQVNLYKQFFPKLKVD